MNTSGMVQSIVDFLPPEQEQYARAGLVSEIRETMKNIQIKKFC